MIKRLPLTKSELATLAKNILEDFESISGPFQPKHLPEKKVISEIDGERETTLFLTFTASVNYRKETAGERGLWQTMKRLWEGEQWPFEPSAVVRHHSYAELIDLFEARPIIAWKDPHIWFRNALTFHRNYDNDPRNLFAENDWNAVKALEYMRANGQEFPYLKGEKISSLWLRLIHEEVHELEDIEDIPIPVDSRIRSLSKRLIAFNRPDGEVTDIDIREEWNEICDNIDSYPVRLDQPLWLIEKNWHEWGEQYLQEIIRSQINEQ